MTRVSKFVLLTLICRTILSYPISPFFIIFCNVVGTSDVRDFQLLQDVVDSVSSLVMENKYVGRLRRLCNTLLALCRPLVQNLHPAALQERQLPAHSRRDEDTTPGHGHHNVLENGSNEVGSFSGITGAEAWQDDMMWQLFQAQPSLDWFNSDILDPAVWELDFPN